MKAQPSRPPGLRLGNGRNRRTLVSEATLNAGPGDLMSQLPQPCVSVSGFSGSRGRPPCAATSRFNPLDGGILPCDVEGCPYNPSSSNYNDTGFLTPAQVNIHKLFDHNIAIDAAAFNREYKPLSTGVAVDTLSLEVHLNKPVEDIQSGADMGLVGGLQCCAECFAITSQQCLASSQASASAGAGPKGKSGAGTKAKAGAGSKAGHIHLRLLCHKDQADYHRTVTKLDGKSCSNHGTMRSLKELLADALKMEMLPWLPPKIGIYEVAREVAPVENIAESGPSKRQCRGRSGEGSDDNAGGGGGNGAMQPPAAVFANPMAAAQGSGGSTRNGGNGTMQPPPAAAFGYPIAAAHGSSGRTVGGGDGAMQPPLAAVFTHPMAATPGSGAAAGGGGNGAMQLPRADAFGYPMASAPGSSAAAGGGGNGAMQLPPADAFRYPMASAPGSGGSTAGCGNGAMQPPPAAAFGYPMASAPGRGGSAAGGGNGAMQPPQAAAFAHPVAATPGSGGSTAGGGNGALQPPPAAASAHPMAATPGSGSSADGGYGNDARQPPPAAMVTDPMGAAHGSGGGDGDPFFVAMEAAMKLVTMPPGNWPGNQVTPDALPHLANLLSLSVIWDKSPTFTELTLKHARSLVEEIQKPLNDTLMHGDPGERTDVMASIHKKEEKRADLVRNRDAILKPVVTLVENLLLWLRQREKDITAAEVDLKKAIDQQTQQYLYNRHQELRNVYTLVRTTDDLLGALHTRMGNHHQATTMKEHRDTIGKLLKELPAPVEKPGPPPTVQDTHDLEHASFVHSMSWKVHSFSQNAHSLGVPPDPTCAPSFRSSQPSSETTTGQGSSGRHPPAEDPTTGKQSVASGGLRGYHGSSSNQHAGGEATPPGQNRSISLTDTECPPTEKVKETQVVPATAPDMLH